MGKALGLSSDTPGEDPALKAARLEAEKKAADEKARLDALEAEEAEAMKRGLRGPKALLSSAGQLGFPTTVGPV